MSNQSTDLQKAESKEATPPKQSLSIATTGEIIRTVGSMVTIIGGLSVFLVWFYSLSPLLYIPLIVIVFLVAFIAFYHYSIRPRLIALEAENIVLKDLVHNPKAVQLLESTNFTPENKKVRAEIKGTIKEGSFKNNGDFTTVRISVQLANIGDETVLMSAKLLVSRPFEKQSFESSRKTFQDLADDMPNLGKLMQQPRSIVKPGIPIDGWFEFTFRNISMQYSELFCPTLLITNGFDETYEITNDKLTLRKNR